MIRGFMLVALVASKMEPEPEEKPKFIDYVPEPRKKRDWKKKRIKLTTYPIIMKTGIELIAKERKEQIEKHGFDVNNDDGYSNEELRLAAIYALTMDRVWYPDTWNFWWHDKMVKKEECMSEHDFYIERLKIAGALIAAEIDRLNSKP